ncbi:hypothetical protein TSAR_000163 [Trichomalopsis sarcophagae]|uniref:Uncharacterized protein n=1 Tax=Trichomalopsis sarcophagae TaxID=543379 RepID=A0A232EWY4_9HYME|nr:hypothetical protein TSAR_000163 [Trichomalopsis sarcophagae]
MEALSNSEIMNSSQDDHGNYKDYSILTYLYKSLKKEIDILDSNVLDILPKYIEHRYSLCGQVDKVDEDSLLLIENIKYQGYYVADRRKSFDLQHSKLALLSIANLHTLGIALKIKRSEDFEKSNL